MAEDYVLFSGVTIGSGSGPVVLSANLTPPDAPTSGVLQTDNYSGSWYQTFSFLQLPSTDLYVLLHTNSGFYARVTGLEQPIQLQTFTAFDPSFYFTLGGQGPQNLVIYSALGNGLCVNVAGSNWQPGGAVIASTFVSGQAGMVWQFLPVDKHAT